MPTKKKPATSAARSASVRDRKLPVDLGRALVEAFLTNERMNQVLLDLLDPKVWRAQPPCSKRRNIATSFAHIHNVRCMRLKMSAKDAPTPARSIAPKSPSTRQVRHSLRALERWPT